MDKELHPTLYDSNYLSTLEYMNIIIVPCQFSVVDTISEMYHLMPNRWNEYHFQQLVKAAYTVRELGNGLYDFWRVW